MVGVILSVTLSAGLCLAAFRVGPRLGYVDLPDDPDLKAHSQPAVPLGGVGIFAAFHTGLAAVGLFDGWLFGASFILLGLGLVDDRVGLAPLTRLLVEVAAGAVLVAGLAGSLGWLLGVGAGILLVITVNAVNLFDGLDGLAGSVALVSALAAAGLAGLRDLETLPGLILAAALAGFLVLNWHPARVFLGDNGAYTVGGLLVGLLAWASEGSAPLFDLGVGAGLLGVFLVDLAGTVLRRMIARQPLFSRDRNHVYDRLHARGLSVPAVAIVTALAQAGLCAIALVVAALAAPGWAVAAVAVLGIASVVALATVPVLAPFDP